VGKLLGFWCRKISLAVHLAHAENVLRRLFAVADDVEAASSSVGMPSPATALFTRAVLPRAARETPLVASTFFISSLCGSFLCFLGFHLLGLCTMQRFNLPCLGFHYPLVTLALLVPSPVFASTFLMCLF
jgi:hypothetical protein